MTEKSRNEALIIYWHGAHTERIERNWTQELTSTFFQVFLSIRNYRYSQNEQYFFQLRNREIEKA